MVCGRRCSTTSEWVAQTVSTGFRRKRDGSFAARFDAAEAGVLHTLFAELVAMLDDGEEGSSTGATAEDPLAGIFTSYQQRSKPTDPATARLLPDAYGEDADAAAEFRRYTEGDLRAGKIDAARTAGDSLGAGGRIELSEQQAHAWLRVLNDLRLTLGTRLDVTEDHEEVFGPLAEDDPRKQAWYVYNWLSYLQESLVQALASRL
ncbi:MAG: DUF2017 family protein [Streptosporangiales bacterium]|nr:DUF2017 family protein [Streptosporangiales bacterium]